MKAALGFRADVLARKAKDVGDTTHYAIALRTGVRESTISRLLSGQTVPTLSTLIAVADAYDMALDELVGRTRIVPTQRAARPKPARAAA